MAALPYMPLYVADYLADAAHLSTLEHGAYLLLIMTYWQRGKPLPSDPQKLARIARVSEDEWPLISRNLAEFFVDDGESWSHKRIDAELAKVAEKSEKARTAGKASASSRQEPSRRSTDAQRTLNHTDTDTDTDTEYNLKQPSPTIPREAGLRSENQDWDLLEARCREAAGWQNEPHPKLAVIGPIVELIKSGASLEMDVIPIIAALAPKCRSRSGWAYFVGPIQDAMATRVNARAPPSVAKSQAENVANLAALQEKYGWKPGAKAQAG